MVKVRDKAKSFELVVSKVAATNSFVRGLEIAGTVLRESDLLTGAI